MIRLAIPPVRGTSGRKRAGASESSAPLPRELIHDTTVALYGHPNTRVHCHQSDETKMQSVLEFASTSTKNWFAQIHILYSLVQPAMGEVQPVGMIPDTPTGTSVAQTCTSAVNILQQTVDPSEISGVGGKFCLAGSRPCSHLVRNGKVAATQQARANEICWQTTSANCRMKTHQGC